MVVDRKVARRTGLSVSAIRFDADEDVVAPAGYTRAGYRCYDARDEFRRVTPEAVRPAVDMLLNAWNAALGQPAYLTSTVAEILGTPPRTFRHWVADHTAASTAAPDPTN